MSCSPASFVLVALVVALGLAGCGSTDDAASAADANASSESTTGEADDTTSTTFKAQLFSSDFETVCAGATQSKASAYTATEPGPHKVILLQGAKGEQYESTIDMPEDWQVRWTQEGDALVAIELVACSELIPGAVVKTCDGYQDSDNQPIDTAVDLRNASYQLTLREATTGKEIATTSIEAAEEDCPTIISSDDTESFAQNNLAIVEFLRSHVQGA